MTSTTAGAAPGPALPGTGPPVPGAAWVRQRRRNVAAFLAQRGLDFSELTALMRERAGDGQVLLTSSPVHGLANPSSDLDFIRVQADPITGPRIATKIFDRGHHLEVISFSAAEVSRSLAVLGGLAAQPPGATVAGLRSWDRQREPRRKQTERIVNGLTADGQLPYLASLPALGAVWSRGSLHTALEQVVYLCLAESAGEYRGRAGYAVNTLLHLADALLSLQGDVYTTRKWYLLRWARARLADTAADPGLRAAAAALDALRTEVAGTPTSPEPIAPLYVGLCLQAAGLVAGSTEVSVAITVAGHAAYHEFLPGAGLLLGGGSTVPVPGPEVLAGLRTPLAQMGQLGQRQAAGLLRAIRAGLASAQLAYQPQEEAA